MVDKDPHAPPEVTTDEESLVVRTEHLADLALDRLRKEAHLPSVREEAGRVAAFVGGIQSRVLAATLGLYLVSAAAGTVIALLADLSDWYMHAAIYAVMLSFLVIYVKAHHHGRRFARAFYALVTLGLFVFFAWVLDDLVPARLLVEEGSRFERSALPILRLPAVLLLVTAAALLIHWVVIVRLPEDP